MGLAIRVTEHPTRTPGVIRFETDRSFTGTGHERYETSPDPLLDKPADRLARLLFETGRVENVHVFGNEVTVTLAPGATTEGLAEHIHDLFIHYREGVEPTVIAT
ncbi:MAG TPA: hypothetical protein VNB24_01550 [Acidimicrobiales bacterium]|nr:hypothetical protein [Acidimicrobiales bacterium]